MVIEPLARYDETGKIQPWLATEIPTVENGGVAKDMMSITWKLKPGVKWSDGSAFTADDVVFTCNIARHPMAVAPRKPSSKVSPRSKPSIR